MTTPRAGGVTRRRTAVTEDFPRDRDDARPAEAATRGLRCTAARITDIVRVLEQSGEGRRMV